MSKFRKWLGRTTVAAAVGVMSLQASAGAAPLDDLNAILEKQATSETPSPISSMLDWDAITKAMNEGGAQVGVNLTVPEALTADMGLPEELSGDLGITADTTVDLTDRKWLLKLAASAGTEDIASLSLYGDDNQLALTLPEFLSKTVGLKAGSLKDQYTGSVWEDMFGELDMPEDVMLKFFPEATEKAGDTTDLIGNIKAILEKATASAQDATEVVTREDEKYPGVTFYDATYNTEEVMNIYRDLLTELSSVLSSSGVTGMEDFDQTMEESLEQGKAILGDQFTVTYWVENDQVTKMTMTMKIDESLMNEATDTTSDPYLDAEADSEAEEESEVTTEAATEAEEPSIVILDLAYTFTDPSDISKGFDMEMDMYDEEDEENVVHLAYAFTNETTDTTSDMSVTLKASDNEENYLDMELFNMSFDAKSGALTAKVTIPGDEESAETAITADSAFENVEAGKGFTWTLKNLTVTAEGTEIPVLSGYVTINSAYEKIDTPSDVDMLADMDTTDVMGLMIELQTNAQQWMEKWGFAVEETEEETGDYGVATLPETNEEKPVVADDMPAETEE